MSCFIRKATEGLTDKDHTEEDEETSVESNDDADDRLRVREVEELGGIMKGVDKVGAEERQ